MSAKIAGYSPSSIVETSEQSQLTVSLLSEEKMWVLRYGVLVMVITSLPYLTGYLSQGEDWHFNGFVFALEDLNSYIANMFSGSAGDWLFRAAYTTLPQRGVLMFLPYILLGKLASFQAVHEQFLAFFHLFRFGAGLLSILATYDFLAFFVKDARIRRMGLVLATVGGGLGWVLVLLGKDNWLGSIPLDFYSPEAFGFLQIYGIPHLALARAFLLWGLLRFIRVVWQYQQEGRTPTRLDGMITGLLWLLAGLSQPLTGMVVGAVAGIYVAAILAWKLWRSVRDKGTDCQDLSPVLRFAITAGLYPVPLVLYNIWSFSTDPYLKAWVVQSTIYAPHPLHYLVAYGPILAFVLLGGIRLIRTDFWKGLFLSAWVLAFPFLAYAPFNLQRRLIEGIWVALVVLGVIGLEAVERALPALKREWMLKGLTVILIPSTVFLLAGGLLAARQPAVPVFLPIDQVKVFQIINKEVQAGSVFLTAYSTGTVLPTWAPVNVVMGQSTESIGLEKLRLQAAAFYQPATSDQERQDLLQEWGVNYVFWGPEERALGGWDPNAADYLTPRFTGGAYSVFEVNP